MKPKPFSSLNHFTVPVAISIPLRGMCTALRGGCLKGNNGGTPGTASAELLIDPVYHDSAPGGSNPDSKLNPCSIWRGYVSAARDGNDDGERHEAQQDPYLPEALEGGDHHEDEEDRADDFENDAH